MSNPRMPLPQTPPAANHLDVEHRGLQLDNLGIRGHEAKTARTLAFFLVGMLGLSFILHEGLVVLMSFYNKAEAVTALEHTFNQWLPVLAGLVGTAVGFYLKERK
jgi:hypothetical protein